jgi:hypothetical protein
MRQRDILILAAAAILVVLAAVFAMQQRDSKTASSALPSNLFPGLANQVNDVATIAVTGAEESFTIAKDKDGKWTMPSKGGHPVPVETVKQALVGMAELKPIEQKTANPELHSKLDLQDRDAKDSKSLEVRLKDAGGKDLAALLIGKKGATATAATPGTLYVRKVGDKQAWLVSGRFEPDPKSVRWFDRDLVKVERKRVNQVTATRGDGTKLVVARETPETDDFKPTNAPAEVKIAIGGASNALGSALGYLSYDDVAPEASVDFADAATAEYRTFDGLVITVAVKEKDGKHWVKFAAAQDTAVTAPASKEGEKDKPKTAEEVAKEVEAFNARVKGWAYEVSKYKAEDFTKTLDDVVEKPKDEKKGS